MHAVQFEAPADGGPRLPPHREQPEYRRTPEPIFNAPWVVVALAVVLIGGYALQSRFPLDAVAMSYAFSPSLMGDGEWRRLFTSTFVHGNWPHVLMNAGMALAFGTPVVRFFGERLAGSALFLLFFVVCGALGCLGYAAINPGQQSALMGASGAVSGLMAAAARLIDGRGGLGRIFSPPVYALGGVWIGINVVIALVGSGLLPGTGGFEVGWEAHIAGFLAGLFLITPFGWIARRT